MKVFAGPRGSGRTSALIAWAREKPSTRVIVVIDTPRRDRIRAMADVMIWVYTVPCPFWHSAIEIGIDDYECFFGRSLPYEFTRCLAAIAIESEDYLNIDPPQPAISMAAMCSDLSHIEADLR